MICSRQWVRSGLSSPAGVDRITMDRSTNEGRDRDGGALRYEDHVSGIHNREPDGRLSRTTQIGNKRALVEHLDALDRKAGSFRADDAEVYRHSESENQIESLFGWRLSRSTELLHDNRTHVIARRCICRNRKLEGIDRFFAFGDCELRLPDGHPFSYTGVVNLPLLLKTKAASARHIRCVLRVHNKGLGVGARVEDQYLIEDRVTRLQLVREFRPWLRARGCVRLDGELVI